MPSTMFLFQSGGMGLMASGQTFSGSFLDVGRMGPGCYSQAGGVQLKLAKLAVGTVYIGLPGLSGTVNTINSGGSESFSGLPDGMELNPGDAFFVPRYRLRSGLESVRILGTAGESGARIFWEVL